MRTSIPTLAFLAAAALAAGRLSSSPASAHRIAVAVGSPQDHSTEADTLRASGTFDVTLTPETPADDVPGTIGRMSIEKRFHGDLVGTSVGEMLAAMTAVDGSAAYVAIETVTGTLHGRSGTFVLQHSGTMARGAQRLSVRVVPDSGTGELAGLEGEMSIEIADGRHSYVFEYTLPAMP